jgi:CRP-like cAMP-binding protein
MELRDVVRRYPLFAATDPSWLDGWLASGQVVSFGLGDTLTQSGAPGEWVHAVEAGTLRVLRPTRSGKDVSLGTFGPGDLFGEYALLRPGLTPATCRGCDAGRVWRFPLGPLREHLTARPEIQGHLRAWLRLHALLRHLRDQSFLGFMSATSFLPLLDRCHLVSIPAVRTVQADGLADDSWFFIQGGEVALHTDDPGPPITLGPGDCFGERALLSLATLPVAMAFAPCRLLRLSSSDFYVGVPGEPPTECQTILPVRPRPSGAAHPWVGQREEADCGPAALAMVARRWGKDVSAEDVRRLAPPGANGVSLLALRRAAEALGFRCQAVRIGVEQLGGAALPAIVHQAGGHFVVAYGFEEGRLVVGDPALGVRRLPIREVLKSWTCNVLLCLPDHRLIPRSTTDVII